MLEPRLKNDENESLLYSFPADTLDPVPASTAPSRNWGAVRGEEGDSAIGDRGMEATLGFSVNAGRKPVILKLPAVLLLSSEDVVPRPGDELVPGE